MANKKLSEGVGKKIVEALKKQSEIEISPVSAKNQDDLEALTDELSNAFDAQDTTNDELQDAFSDNFADTIHQESDDFLDTLSNETESFNNDNITLGESPVISSKPFAGRQQQVSNPQDSFMNELDGFEIPNNIAVLKKLIAQLPSGVTRHTGAQIIKQTMEALGISMKSVLQEAQQVQEGLNNSAKECYSTIEEYKKQIKMLEKQAQNYQKQYGALNELISLFIQTGV